MIDIEDPGYIDVENFSIDLDLNITKQNSGVEIALNSLILDYGSLNLNFGNCIGKRILSFLTEKMVDIIWPLLKSSIANSLKTILDQVDFFLLFY